MVKRWRSPTAKPGELKVVFGKADGDLDIFYCHGGAGAARPDARMLSSFFESLEGLHGNTLRQELELRGYDITTFKFTIQQKDA